MAKLVILRGVPGCGKSTYAARLAAKSGNGYNIVSRDELREMLFGSAEVFSDEGKVTAVQDALIKYDLERGTNVIVDNTNVELKYVKAIIDLAPEGTDVVVEVFDVALEEALRRNELRGRLGGRRVPEEVIRHYHERLQLTKDWTP